MSSRQSSQKHKLTKQEKITRVFSPDKQKWREQFPILDLTLNEINKAHTADNGKVSIEVSGFKNNVYNSANLHTITEECKITTNNTNVPRPIYIGGVEANNLPGGTKKFKYSLKTLKQSIKEVYWNLTHLEHRMAQNRQGGGHAGKKSKHTVKNNTNKLKIQRIKNN